MSQRRDSGLANEGDLAQVSLQAVIVQLAGSEVTGVLTVQNEEDIIAVSFEVGEIVGADALNETLEEGLGKALMQEGLLTQAEFSSVLDRIRTERSRLGDILLHEDMLSRADYLAAVRRYTAALLQRALAWQTGDYKFYAGDEVSYEEGFEPIRVAEVVAADLVQKDRKVADPTPAVEETEVEEPDGEIEEAVGEAPTEMVDEAPEEDLEAETESLARVRQFLRLDEAGNWLGWLMPALIVVLLAAVVLGRPNFLVYPFFWLESERLELEKQHRASVYMKVDRAAKTFFLLEGRFPDDLHTLVARGLASSDDIVGSDRRILNYTPGDRGYVIRSSVSDGTDPGVSKPQAILGNFFLDPEFVILAPRIDTVPLVLLD